MIVDRYHGDDGMGMEKGRLPGRHRIQNRLLTGCSQNPTGSLASKQRSGFVLTRRPAPNWGPSIPQDPVRLR